MRIRSQVDNDVPEAQELHHSVTYSAPQGTTFVSYVAPLKSSKVTSDVVIPDFFKRRDNGEIFNNPYSRVSTVVKETPGRIVITGSRPPPSITLDGKTITTMGKTAYGMQSAHYYFDPLSVPVSGIDEQSLIDLASNSAWSRVSASDASAMVSLAELTKTVDYVKGTLFQVMRIVKAIKKLDARVLRKEVDFSAIADTYMGLRYGLRPLLIDADQAVKAYNATREVGKRVTARGKASNSSYDNVTVDGGIIGWQTAGDGTPLDVTRETRCDASFDVSVRAYVLYELEPILLPKLQTWGFHDFVGLAWELIPFSFIAGWFMNFSDTLAAWQPKVGVKVLASGYTIERTRMLTYAHFEAVPLHEYYASGDQSIQYVSYSELHGATRQVFESHKERVVGDFRSTPSIDIKLDIFKLTDMALILRSITRK